MEWTLSLRLEAPYRTGGMLLEVDLETCIDGKNGEFCPPAWVSRLGTVQGDPLHVTCPVVWLLHYARAVVRSDSQRHTSVMAAWWRIIRFTAYVLVSCLLDYQRELRLTELPTESVRHHRNILLLYLWLPPTEEHWTCDTGRRFGC